MEETVSGWREALGSSNAALNLKRLAVSSTVTACGEEGADRIITDAVKPASMKQEPNTTNPHGIVVHVEENGERCYRTSACYWGLGEDRSPGWQWTCYGPCSVLEHGYRWC
jgi:hypothetical protein